MRIFYNSLLLLIAFFFTGCLKRGTCDNTPRPTTAYISFYIKNRLTGNDYYTSSPGQFTVPDSVKLLHLKTGNFFQLGAFNSNNQLIFSSDYIQNANVRDSLVFYFGSAVPDTLVVETGIVNGWRGDECPTVKDVGITKVSLRNQVLLQTTDDLESFTLSK